jgi:hypothetical protein
MPPLPKNLVKNMTKPPVFDNPLRRTAPSGIDSQPASPAITDTSTAPQSQPEAVEAQSEQGPNGIVIPFAGSRVDAGPEPTATQPEPTAAENDHRITVRIDDETRCALENECHRRRIAGEKAKVAEIARSILTQWARRMARRMETSNSASAPARPDIGQPSAST